MCEVEAAILKIWSTHAWEYFKTEKCEELTGVQVQAIMRVTLIPIITGQPYWDPPILRSAWEDEYDVAKKDQVLQKLFPNDQKYLKTDFPKPPN